MLNIISNHFAAKALQTAKSGGIEQPENSMDADLVRRLTNVSRHYGDEYCNEPINNVL